MMQEMPMVRMRSEENSDTPNCRENTSAPLSPSLGFAFNELLIVKSNRILAWVQLVGFVEFGRICCDDSFFFWQQAEQERELFMRKAC